MAQKMIGQETVRTGLVKPRKAVSSANGLITGGIVTEEIVINVSDSETQEYPEVNAAIKRGLADVAAGRVTRMSFAEYADISVED